MTKPIRASFTTQVERLHQLGILGEGVHIGLIDSGVDTTHAVFKQTTTNGCLIDFNGYILPKTAFKDDTGHGTQTASLIVGNDAANHFTGIAPKAQLYAVGALEGGKRLLRILKGLEWLLHQPIDVLCMPLGFQGYHPILEVALRSFWQKNIPIIAPMGNGGINSYVSPACFPEVLAVGSVDDHGNVSSFSGNIHLKTHLKVQKPNIVTIGENIRVAQRGGSYTLTNGTSMSAALVAGIMALMKGIYPDISTQQLYQILYKTAYQANKQQKYRVGKGIVQPFEMYKALQQSTIEPFSNHRTSSFIPYWIDPIFEQQVNKANDTDDIAAIIYIQNQTALNLAKNHLNIIHFFEDFSLVYVAQAAKEFKVFVEQNDIRLLSGIINRS
ncbi:MAG: S8/S53 family peptidase [Bacteroidota bacterium]